MMIRLVALVALVALMVSGLTASYSAPYVTASPNHASVTADHESPSLAIDTSLPVYRQCFTDPEGCLEIYTDTLGEVRYRELDGGATVTFDQSATAEQQQIYEEHVATVELSNASKSLESDIEGGKKIVQWLQEYAQEHRDTASEWDTLTTSQQIARMKLKFAKDAKVMDGLADLLIYLDKGR